MNREAQAALIADILSDCNTDFRGDLLMEVADELRVRTQFHTAKVIEAAARVYGLSGRKP